MSMQDSLSDMLTRIRNAQLVKHSKVLVTKTNVNKKVVEILCEEGYLNSYQEREEGVKKFLDISLKYYKEEPVIESIKRASKPSRRVYRSKDEIPKVNSGLGVAIVSTSKGIMTGKKAKELGCGGEILCLVA